MRTIVIAPTVTAGRARFPEATAILTPRSRTAARGMSADRIVVLASMRDHRALPALRADATPCLRGAL